MTARPEQSPCMGTIALVLTYRCPISCSHCKVDAGPRRKEKMALGSALGWIDEAAACGAVKNIELTGGEPFYDLQTLAIVSDHALQAGLTVSVVTNACWSGTIEHAVLTLNRLPAIRRLSISTDLLHERFIPLGHIHNAIIAADLLGRSYEVTVTSDDEHGEAHRSFMRRLHRIVDPAHIKTRPIYPAGRARMHEGGLQAGKAAEPSGAACPAPGKPLILPDGRVLACTGPLLKRHKSSPLSLGNLKKESLSSVLDRAESDRILRLIRAWGPHRLVSLLDKAGHGELLPKEYLCGSGCDICNKLLFNRRLVGSLLEILDRPEFETQGRHRRMHRLDSGGMARRYRGESTESFNAADLIFQPEA